MSYAFIHVPKCGGTFVKDCVRMIDLPCCVTPSHLPYQESVERCGEGLHYFGVVRNPYTWYQSFFCFRHDRGWVGNGNWRIGFRDMYETSFEKWVIRVVQEFPGYLSKDIFESYLGPCETVLRQETLTGELVQLFGDERIRDVPRSNARVTECRHTRLTRRLIAVTELIAFRRYGYDVDDVDA